MYVSFSLSRGAYYPLHYSTITHMASFASVYVSAPHKTIVPCSVTSLDPSKNFVELFRSVQAGKYGTDPAAAVLESSSVSVGKSKYSFFPR